MAAHRSPFQHVLTTILLLGSSHAFSRPPRHHNFISTRRSASVSLSAQHDDDDDDHQLFLASAVLGLVLATTTALPLEAPAYEASDYASETVTQAVKSLTDAQGNADNTFSAFEELEAIITEGKGVGGSINYRKYKPRYLNTH